MARPRARTQTGKASCNSACSVDVTAIHASPARTRAARAAGKLGTRTTAAGAEGRHEALPGAVGFLLRPAPEEQGDREEHYGGRVEGEDDRDAAQVGDD